MFECYIGVTKTGLRAHLIKNVARDVQLDKLIGDALCDPYYEVFEPQPWRVDQMSFMGKSLCQRCFGKAAWEINEDLRHVQPDLRLLLLGEMVAKEQVELVWKGRGRMPIPLRPAQRRLSGAH